MKRAADGFPLFFEKNKEALQEISPGITREEITEILKGFFNFFVDNMEGRHLIEMKLTRFGTFKPISRRIGAHINSMYEGYKAGRISKDEFNIALLVAKTYYKRTGFDTTRIDKFNYIEDDETIND